MPKPRRLTMAAAALLAAVALPALFQAAPAPAAAPPRVSIISDSILTAVTWSGDGSLAALGSGLDLQIDAGVCRRLNGQSCLFNGAHVPTTLEMINRWSGQLGSIVVIVDGYNDLPDPFASDVELVLGALRDQGVQHVLWVNLHEVTPELAVKNAVLAAAARRHPELRVLDWNGYSAPHPDWYQTDFVHLRQDGGDAIAAWIRQAIADVLDPPAPPVQAAVLTVPLQTVVARVGVPFDHRLQAGGGAAPLRWRVSGGALRRAGLHLSAGGELTGTPLRASRFAVQLAVSDAGGARVATTVAFTVKPARRAA